ncbi:MAG: L-seryl-tRNA(Sec) selenium transferase [Anaerolineales bacterium]|nr:L-seryl-tRNA(Sec) selenium transferase [Anaerolineales bacterium]
MSELRALPSVDAILQNEDVKGLMSIYGRPLTTEAIRLSLDETRKTFQSHHSIPELSFLLTKIQKHLSEWATPSIMPVINATGVILHTNLGRAPLSLTAIRAMQVIGQGYSNLEFDLENGKRGSRYIHAETLLQQLTGAEAALVVNNNASAVLLILTALARRRAVVIARSQLIEIGGGFRVPDVMKQSGARLIEIGTTNRIHLSDYEQALEENPVAFLRAHRSNFRMVGFTSEPEVKDILSIAHKAGIIFIDDLGSGALIDTTKFGLGHEPTIQESLQAGADLVCFSGDKLLGGPQAGIILGKMALITKLKKHPLARAIRTDKFTLAGLSATLLHYLKNEAELEIPVWRMISMPLEQITTRANNWQKMLNAGEVINGLSTVGGGSLPGETLPTTLFSIEIKNPQAVLKKLRNNKLAIVARIQNDRIVFDPRTVLIEQEEVFTRSLKTILSGIL